MGGGETRLVQEIRIQSGLSADHAAQVLAHEFMHAWLWLQGFPHLPKQLEEGLCELASFLYLLTLLRDAERPPLEDRPPLGGEGPPLGGERPPLGGEGPPLGGERPPLGGERPPLGGERPPLGAEIEGGLSLEPELRRLRAQLRSIERNARDDYGGGFRGCVASLEGRQLHQLLGHVREHGVLPAPLEQTSLTTKP